MPPRRGKAEKIARARGLSAPLAVKIALAKPTMLYPLHSLEGKNTLLRAKASSLEKFRSHWGEQKSHYEANPNDAGSLLKFLQELVAKFYPGYALPENVPRKERLTIIKKVAQGALPVFVGEAADDGGLSQPPPADASPSEPGPSRAGPSRAGPSGAGSPEAGPSEADPSGAEATVATTASGERGDSRLTEVVTKMEQLSLQVARLASMQEERQRNQDRPSRRKTPKSSKTLDLRSDMYSRSRGAVGEAAGSESSEEQTETGDDSPSDDSSSSDDEMPVNRNDFGGRRGRWKMSKSMKRFWEERKRKPIASVTVTPTRTGLDMYHRLFLNYDSARKYVNNHVFKKERNRHEAQVIGFSIDALIADLGFDRVLTCSAGEILIRRLAAVIHADEFGWHLASEIEVQVDTPGAFLPVL